MREDLERRFMALPAVEQNRLLNLAKWMSKGRHLDQSLLAGFPRESIDIMDEMLKDKLVNSAQHKEV